MVKFEVYADTVYGSDVLTFDTIEEALKEAKEWKKHSNNNILIVRVEETLVAEIKE